MRYTKCKECDKKQISYGDYDKKGRQLYWCNTYGGYVTDEAETKNCKIVIGGTMWSEECLSSKNRVEV